MDKSSGGGDARLPKGVLMYTRHAMLGMMLACIALLTACAATPPTEILPTLLVLPSATPETPTPEISPTVSPEPTVLVALPATPEFTATPSFTPSITPTSTVGPSPTATLTPSMTITDTPTRTASPTPWPTEVEGPLFEIARLALSATIVTPNYSLLTTTPTGIPSGGVQPSLCLPPTGGFGSLYIANPSLNLLLGCSQGGTLNYGAAAQWFERGMMIYLATTPAAIYVVYNNGRWAQYADTFLEEVDPASGGETAPSGLFEPIRGFGKVWRSNADVRGGLGWASTTESGTTATVLYFQRGQMIAIPLYGQIIALGTTGESQILVGNP